MPPNPLAKFLERNAIYLVMFGFVKGARWAMANSPTVNRCIDGFTGFFKVDHDVDTLARTYFKMQEEYNEMLKGNG